MAKTVVCGVEAWGVAIEQSVRERLCGPGLVSKAIGGRRTWQAFIGRAT
jgi:hypothetical protein